MLMTERTVNNKNEPIIMSPRSKEDFEKMRETSKKKIMDTAFELFAERGYYQTSIAEVAAKAQVSKGLIYNYFESKEALLLALVQKSFDKIVDYFPYLSESSHVDAAALLDRYIRDIIKLLAADKGFWRLVYALILQKEVAPLIAPLLQEFTESYMPMLYGAFEELGYKYPAAMANLFGVHFDGIALGYIAAGGLGDEDEIIQTLIDLYIPKEKRKS